MNKMDQNAAASAQTWYRQFWQRVRPNMLLKVLGTMLFMVVFFVAYIYLLKNPQYPVLVMPLIAPDRIVGFFPLALLLYISLWVYVSLPPIFFVSRRGLMAYGWDIGVVCVVGLLCFWFVPTAVPPANIDWSIYPGMGFLKGVDAAGNACPSLHVATAVFSGIWLNYHLKDMGWRRSVRWGNWLWCLGIVYSTMATKQHVALDVLAGSLLGGVGAWLSLRRRVYRSEPSPVAG